MIKKENYKILIIIYSFLGLFKNVLWGAQGFESAKQQMPFKLGFEFQESSSLCKWAEEDVRVQKKPLFCISQNTQPDSINSNVPLWHVVLDTSDIEFVTRPFVKNETIHLKNCIESIVSSIEILKNLLVKHANITFDQWLEELFDRFRNSPFLISCSQDNYKSIGLRNIEPKTSAWEPIFSPQVTIQHPLEYTIPLYYGLFGFKSSYMMPFSASLPGREIYFKAQEQAQENGDSSRFWKQFQGFRQKIIGLHFLHALTLVQMTPTDQELNDGKDLNETLNYLNAASQVDPKMMLALMSRRSFSQMCQDIKYYNNYAENFHKLMSYNRAFTEIYTVPQRFKHTNYAEQFFDPSTGQPKDLTPLSDFLNQDFFKKNNEIISQLLKKGVFSTVMIRNFKKDIKIGKDQTMVCDLLNSYYEDGINSVSFPQKRYIMDLVGYVVQETDSAHDVLSPPHFLSNDNSMGGFKEDNNYDAYYGEAIIEVRAIRNVGAWFLKQCDLNELLAGKFLISPDETLIEQASKLFMFLGNFGSEQNYQDLALGISYAARKY